MLVFRDPYCRMAPYFKRYKQIKVHKMRQIKTHLNSKTQKKIQNTLPTYMSIQKS